MSRALRQRSLAALTAALQPRKHQLFQLSPAGTAGTVGPLAAFLPEVEEATWRLVYACLPVHTSNMLLLMSACILPGLDSHVHIVPYILTICGTM